MLTNILLHQRARVNNVRHHSESHHRSTGPNLLRLSTGAKMASALTALNSRGKITHKWIQLKKIYTAEDIKHNHLLRHSEIECGLILQLISSRTTLTTPLKVHLQKTMHSCKWGISLTSKECEKYQFAAVTCHHHQQDSVQTVPSTIFDAWQLFNN